MILVVNSCMFVMSVRVAGWLFVWDQCFVPQELCDSHETVQIWISTIQI